MTTSSPRRADLLFLFGWFAASRMIAAAAGVTPPTIGLEYIWQLAPLELLRTHYAETLWYLHSQPPLYNALVGIALALPGSPESWISIWWMASGLGMSGGMLWTFLHAGMPRVASHIIVMLFGLNPTLRLYENFALYSYPEAACVLGGFIGFLNAARGEPRGPALAALMASLLVLLRAAFQLPWTLAIAAAGLAPLRRLSSSRFSVAALCAPVMIAGLLTLKNGIMFDVWTTSSWYGMNMTNLAAKTLALADRFGETPVLFAFHIGAFRPISEYPSLLRAAVEREMAHRYGTRPILNSEFKASGSPNFNHVGYLAVSRRLAADSLALVRTYPAAFRLALREGLRRFFLPCSEYDFLIDNRMRLAGIERMYSAVLYPGGSSVLVMAWLLFAVLSATYFWVSGFSPPGHWLAPAAGYLLVTTTWLMCIGNLTEFGENNRFRFTLDPMIFTWNVLVLEGARRRFVSLVRNHPLDRTIRGAIGQARRPGARRGLLS
jgi:hypothetical protein